MNPLSSARHDPESPDDAAGSRGPLDRTGRLIRVLERAPDPGAIERLAVTLAVHPEGAGCTRAWLLVWNARRGVLEGRRFACATPGAAAGAQGSLEQALTLALHETPSTAGIPEGAEFRRLKLSPSRLTGAAAQAWHQAAPLAGLDEPLPWDDGPVLAAAVLRPGTVPFALLIGAWDDATPADPSIEWIAALATRALALGAETRMLRRRARQVAAMAEAARAAVTAHNLAEVLRLVARLAAEALTARGSALWLASEGERRARLEMTHGVPALRERIGQGLAPLATDVIEHPRVRLLDPVTDDPLLSPETAAQLDTVLIVPIVAFGQVLGALAVYDRSTGHATEPGGFDAGDVECLGTLADAAAAALDQGHKFETLERRAQEHREMAERLRREERLAMLGESASRLCREGRNPLASIGAFAKRVHRTLAEDDPGRDSLEIVIREAERLERMMTEQMEYAAPDAPRLRVESLNAVIQEVLGGVAETLVRRRIRLLKKLSPDVPELLLDPERMRRVIGNVLEGALESAVTGGRIRVDTRRVQQHAVVEIAHDGGGLPGTLLEQLFVPFASGRYGGPAVGLGVAQQIVREHGGEIRVRSEGEWSTIFTFTLPIHDNRDRRDSVATRRSARRDRRAMRER